jgi:cytosine/adenosine deaminase-related metal-dependent hydrolase
LKEREKMKNQKNGSDDKKTMIKGDWVVGFDGNSHVLLQDGAVVYQDGEILWVGKSQGFSEAVDRCIEGKGRVIIPGLINMHSHAAVHTGELVMADTGRSDVYNSGILSFLPTHGAKAKPSIEVSDREYLLGSKFAFCEMVKAGSTTIVEVGCLGATVDIVGGYTGSFIDIVDEVGFRAYISPGFGSETMQYDKDGRIIFVPSENDGFDQLEGAVKFIQDNAGTADGRVQGMLFPVVDLCCSQKLLRESAKAAESLDVRMQTHCAEALLDHHECLRRNKMSLVEYLAEAEWLGPRAILGHAVYTSAHPWSVYPHGRDLELIAKSGASVANCATVFGRRGMALHSFQRYQNAGINMVLGTDTYPMDIITEMRHAAYLCRVVEGDFAVASSRAVFEAATINAAKALGRDDLGRLAPGAKADIVSINMDQITIGPYFDPVRAIVNCANGRDVDMVVVDGVTILEQGCLSRVDEQKMLHDAKRITERDITKILSEYWQGRSLEEVAPPSFPIVSEL